MRILVYGAGNIGCLYAAKLARSGQEVTVLARGHRYEDLRDQGITLEHGVSGERETASIAVIDQLDADAAYDLVLVALPKHALDDVLPVLADNRHTPTVMFFGNNVSGPEPMTSALGNNRVLLGFPGAAAIPGEDAIQYVITSRQEQPTTIGEIDGKRSERVTAIAAVFEKAGFPTSICANMDAWLKTHVAKILPTIGALFCAGGKVESLASNQDAIRLMVRAMRECLVVITAADVPITPSNHRVLQWLPESLIIFIMKRMLSTETMAIKVGHAEQGLGEFKSLKREFAALNAARLPTPALDELFEHLPSAEVYDLAS